MAKQTTLIDYVSVIIYLFERFRQHRSSLMGTFGTSSSCV